VKRARRGSLLLRLYPADWRARYGDELQALLAETSPGGHPSWRARADVALSAGRERLHRGGLLPSGGPGERMRAGSLLVLCSWAAFVLAGALVQKTSEHWQAAVPASQRAVPAIAFWALVAGAAAGAALVLTGVAVALPSAASFLRAGGWARIRRRIATAAAATGITAAAVGALATWAHRLAPAQRNGHDLLYGLAATTVFALLVACAATWTAVAVAIACRLELRPAVLTFETHLAAAVTAAMAVTTLAAAAWWVALASRAPAFLAGGGPGPNRPLPPQLLVALPVMLAATLVATAGSTQALRGRRAS
jgi:hypothetical protein